MQADPGPQTLEDRPNRTVPPFQVMTKPGGARCNIACTYCYYLEKERLYPGEKRFRMTNAVLERYVRDMIRAAVEGGWPEVQFSWQGGEPTLLGIAFFERAVALQNRYRPPHLPVRNAFQTNGMLLDEDWGRFLARERFLVGISIDGPRAIHDRYRRDRAGRPSFDKVMKGLDVLRRHGITFNILASVHRESAIQGKQVYRFLSGLGSAFLQFNPVIECTNHGDASLSAPGTDGAPEPVPTAWSVTPRAYGKFLCDVFDTWYRKDVGRVFVQFFESQVGLWAGLPANFCILDETCGGGFALEHNGDLYACDHFVYPGYCLGNIMETPLAVLAGSDRAQRFGRGKRDGLTAQCRTCPYLFACNGGCPKHRILRSEDGEPRHNYFCESYLRFFHHAGDRLKRLAVLAACV